jgi:hypothetical protein
MAIVVDHRDYQLIADLERNFADTMRTVIGQLLHSDVNLVEEYQRTMAMRPSYERLLALHESPLEVASRLAGVSITDEIEENYDYLFGDHSDDDSAAVAGGDSVEDSQRLVERGMPYESLEFVLLRLGYRRTSKLGDELVVWEHKIPMVFFDIMRPFVILPSSYHLTSSRMVDESLLIEFLNYIFFERLSSDDLKSLFDLLFRVPNKPH